VKIVSTSGMHRRIFFKNFEDMSAFIDLIAREQGFEDRVDQYKVQKKIPDGFICKRRIVKHKKAGFQLELKTLGSDVHPSSVELFR